MKNALPTGPHGSCVSVLKLAVKEKITHSESKTASERKVSALYDCNEMQNSTKKWFLELRLVPDAKTRHQYANSHLNAKQSVGHE